MHNRGRLIVGSFLTKTLYLDWREGAGHFLHHLVDGDIANNQLNWQWVAGTGTDTRPSRVLNPLRQAERYDPDGAYVRRYVPELANIEGPAVHTPVEAARRRTKGARLPRSDRRSRRGPTAVPRRPGGGRAMSAAVRRWLFADQLGPHWRRHDPGCRKISDHCGVLEPRDRPHVLKSPHWSEI